MQHFLDCPRGGLEDSEGDHLIQPDLLGLLIVPSALLSILSIGIVGTEPRGLTQHVFFRGPLQDLG